MMAVRARLRAEMRSSWRSWLALALIIGAFAGVVLGVAAGARRTSTAFPRLIRASGASDVQFAAFSGGRDGYYAQVAREWGDDIVTMSVVAGLPLAPLGQGGEIDFASSGNALAPVDPRVGFTVDRPQLVTGRLPALDAPDEAMVNEPLAELLGLRVGSTLPMGVLRSMPEGPDVEPDVTPITVTVVGIGRFIEEVVPTAKFDAAERLLMSPAAYRAYGAPNDLFFDVALVRLRDGVDIAAFRASAIRLARSLEGGGGGEILFADHVQRNRRVERTIHPQAVALWLFAGFAGLAGFLVLGQALSRQLHADADDVAVLCTLGMTRSQLMGLALLRTAAIAVVAAAVAVATAILLSPLFPIGAARRAELHPGVEVNLAVLAAGAGVIVVLLLLRAGVPAWRLASSSGGGPEANLRESDRPGLVARALASVPLSPAATAGVRMAVEPGGGRSAVPVRATLVGAMVALAAVAAALTFASNLDRVVTTPALYGRTWDLLYDSGFGALVREPVEAVLDDSPAVAGWSGGFYGETAVAGKAVTAISTDGPVVPAIVEGRRPESSNEVVLGASTLERTGRGIGDRVTLSLGGEDRSMQVVGRAVFPAMGRGSFPSTGLGEGVLTTGGALEPAPESAGRETNDFFNYYLIELRPDATTPQLRALERDLLPLCDEQQACGFSLDATEWERPAEITNLDRIRWTPAVLAGLLAALAVATVGHTLVTSIRRRRRDLAVLKTLGFERRQVSAAVAWQATTFALIAVLVGVPAGIALGRVAWRALAEQLGIVPDVVTPSLALIAALPATVVLANLSAVVPGWLAGRVRPATVLRSE